MSLQKSWPADTFQRIMSAFTHFEKKLNKLQEDVNYHGHTLSELRMMVANISVETMKTPDINIESMKRPVNNTGIQYDETNYTEKAKKSKMKNAVKPFSSKTTARSFQSQKYGITPKTEVPYSMNKLPSSPNNHVKRYAKHRKGEVLRKGSTLRSQKTFEKKKSCK